MKTIINKGTKVQVLINILQAMKDKELQDKIEIDLGDTTIKIEVK